MKQYTRYSNLRRKSLIVISQYYIRRNTYVSLLLYCMSHYYHLTRLTLMDNNPIHDKYRLVRSPAVLHQNDHTPLRKHDTYHVLTSIVGACPRKYPYSYKDGLFLFPTSVSHFHTLPDPLPTDLTHHTQKPHSPPLNANSCPVSGTSTAGSGWQWQRRRQTARALPHLSSFFVDLRHSNKSLAHIID